MFSMMTMGSNWPETRYIVDRLHYSRAGMLQYADRHKTHADSAYAIAPAKDANPELSHPGVIRRANWTPIGALTS